MPCATARRCSGLAYTMHSTHNWCITTYDQCVCMFRDGEVLTNIWNVTCVCGGLVAYSRLGSQVKLASQVRIVHSGAEGLADL